MFEAFLSVSFFAGLSHFMSSSILSCPFFRFFLVLLSLFVLPNLVSVCEKCSTLSFEANKVRHQMKETKRREEGEGYVSTAAAQAHIIEKTAHPFYLQHNRHSLRELCFSLIRCTTTSPPSLCSTEEFTSSPAGLRWWAFRTRKEGWWWWWWSLYSIERIILIIFSVCLVMK